MDVESLLRMERDIPAVKAFLDEVGGELCDDPTGGLFWVRLRPHPEESGFVARIAWTVYPDKTPSVVFATHVRGTLGQTSSWPAAGGYRAPNDICKPFTAEGQAVHPEWLTGVHAWHADGNRFLYVVEILQDDLNRAGWKRAA